MYSKTLWFDLMTSWIGIGNFVPEPLLLTCSSFSGIVCACSTSGRVSKSFRDLKTKIMSSSQGCLTSTCPGYLYIFGLCLTSELCSTGTVTDWTRNSQTPRELDFGSDRDMNHWPPPHDSSSGGDSIYRLSAIPSVSFRSNSFTIRRSSPMLEQKMSIPCRSWWLRQFGNIHTN